MTSTSISATIAGGVDNVMDGSAQTSSVSIAASSQDPFLRSLSALKQILDSPTKIFVSSSTIQQQDLTVQQPKESGDLRISSKIASSAGSDTNTQLSSSSHQIQTLKEELKLCKQKIVVLNKDLENSKATADRERTIRLSLEEVVEKAALHHKLLNQELEAAVAASQSLNEKIESLQAELKNKNSELIDLEDLHKEKVNSLLKEKEAALIKGDQLEARLDSAKQELKEVQSKLQSDRSLALETKEHNLKALQLSDKIITQQRKEIELVKKDFTTVSHSLELCREQLQRAEEEAEQLRKEHMEASAKQQKSTKAELESLQSSLEKTNCELSNTASTLAQSDRNNMHVQTQVTVEIVKTQTYRVDADHSALIPDQRLGAAELENVKEHVTRLAEATLQQDQEVDSVSINSESKVEAVEVVGIKVPQHNLSEQQQVNRTVPVTLNQDDEEQFCEQVQIETSPAKRKEFEHDDETKAESNKPPMSKKVKTKIDEANI